MRRFEQLREEVNLHVVGSNPQFELLLEELVAWNVEDDENSERGANEVRSCSHLRREQESADDVVERNTKLERAAIVTLADAQMNDVLAQEHAAGITDSWTPCEAREARI